MMRTTVHRTHLIRRDTGLRPCARPSIRGRGDFRPARVANDESAPPEDPIPPGCSRYTVRICKPLGIVLEESGGLLRVGDVQAGGNAERHNEMASADTIIRKNDQLVAVSGYARTGQSQVYNDIEVRGGEKMVRIMVGGQPAERRFDIVISAISSHLAGMEVVLEFQRCE